MYDALVLGLGGMGSATLYHLARAGCRTLGLEQFGIPNTRGSSHGSTRIIRLAYSEGPEYVPLLRAAYAGWRELERKSGQSLLHITGGLDIGAPDSWIVTGSRLSCLEHSLRFEELRAEQVNERFPGYCLPTGLRAIYQPDGGYLCSEATIEAHVRLAKGLGAEVRTNCAVLRWDSEASGVRVETEHGDFRARRLVLTAGAWTGRLCPALQDFCTPERQVMLWTAPIEPGAYRPDCFPVFSLEAATGRYYGYPDHCGEGFKIGKFHHLCEHVEEPSRLDRACRPIDEEVLREGIRGHFPLANGPTRRMAACMFTNSPDGHFILDRCPGQQRVFIAAGFSGHGYKFCSVVGRLMAEYCTEGAASLPTERFRLTAERFGEWRRRGRGQGAPSIRHETAI